MSRINADCGGFLIEKVTVRLNTKRFQHLERIARKEGFPATIIVRHLIHRFLDSEIGKGSQPALGVGHE